MADPWDDPETMTQPAPAAAAAPARDPWDEPATPAMAAPSSGPQGGLMQTIPQGISLVQSEEGRAKLWEGIKKFPGDFAQGMIDFVKTPGKAYTQGLTDD